MRYMILNWKMNPATLADAKTLFAATKKAAAKFKKDTVIVAPPALFIPEFAKKGMPLAVQHTHAEDTGSHTGSISLMQARSVGASYAIIGHAEQRALGETDESVRAAVLRALELGMTPIICVGETARDQQGDYLQTLRTQLLAAVGEVPPAKIKKILIAYEPVWKIGAESPMVPHEMHSTAIFIRKILREQFDKAGLSVPILYGGSIDAETTRAMLADGDVSGLLVGRASTTTEGVHALFKALV